MAFITIGEARRRGVTPPNTTSARVLKEDAGTLRKSAARYDIFLSHSFSDAALVLGVKRILEEDGELRVFVDWVEHPELDRSRVTAETAAIIRAAMKNSNSMIFATSETSPSSKWMTLVEVDAMGVGLLRREARGRQGRGPSAGRDRGQGIQGAGIPGTLRTGRASRPTSDEERRRHSSTASNSGRGLRAAQRPGVLHPHPDLRVSSVTAGRRSDLSVCVGKSRGKPESRADRFQRVRVGDALRHWQPVSH